MIGTEIMEVIGDEVVTLDLSVVVARLDDIVYAVQLLDTVILFLLSCLVGVTVCVIFYSFLRRCV